MHTVQLAISNTSYAAVLRDLLAHTENWQVVNNREVPDPNQSEVVLLDEEALNRLQAPLRYPERVVLITRKDPEHLARAWEAGIRSVVFESDSPYTMLLAIMAAALRVISPTPPAPLVQITQPGRQSNAKRHKTT